MQYNTNMYVCVCVYSIHLSMFVFKHTISFIFWFDSRANIHIHTYIHRATWLNKFQCFMAICSLLYYSLYNIISFGSQKARKKNLIGGRKENGCCCCCYILLYSPTQHGSKLSFHLPFAHRVLPMIVIGIFFLLKGQTLIDRPRWRKREREREGKRPSFQCPKFNVNIWNSVPSVLQRDWTRDDIFEWMNEWIETGNENTYIYNRMKVEMFLWKKFVHVQIYN